jgi:hypothetical protein
MFTDYQMSFYCAGGSYVEGLGEYLTQKERDRPGWGRAVENLPGTHITSGSYLDRFSGLLLSYSRRELTFERDALNAFRGLMHDMRRLHPTIFGLSGLPFVVPLDNTHNAWGLSLVQTLCWVFASLYRAPKRRRGFPSWTWAGWNEVVGFETLERLSTYKSTLQDVRLGSETGIKFDPRLVYGQSSHDHFQQTLDTVTEIHFNALEFPVIVAPASWGDARNNDYMVRVAQVWDEWYQGATFARILEETQNREYSCLLMINRFQCRRALIVMAVRWMKDGISAERIGLFYLLIIGPEEFEQVYGPLDKLKRRDVRLI